MDSENHVIAQKVRGQKGRGNIIRFLGYAGVLTIRLFVNARFVMMLSSVLILHIFLNKSLCDNNGWIALALLLGILYWSFYVWNDYSGRIIGEETARWKNETGI